MRRLAIAMLSAAAGLALFGGDASAQQDAVATSAPDDVTAADVAPIDVLQVSGFVDDIIVNEIGNAIERAETGDAQALILQVNSDGTVVDDSVVTQLLEDVAVADVPIGIWVGPSGSRFYGKAAQLLAVADVTGMAPGSRVGYIGVPLQIDAAVTVDFGIAEDRLRNGSVGLTDARALDIFKQRINDEGIPTIANMVQAFDGYDEGGVVIRTTEQVVTDDGNTRFDTIAVVRFSKLSLIDQLFHTVASPPVAYLLLLTGLALLVFEFFTAGVGVAGVVGALCTLLAFSGLWVLPTRPWALALLCAAMLAFAVDVQVGIPRFWTGVGLVFTVIGSWFLFENLPGTTMRPSWIALITGIVGIALTFIVGMPNMVRTRFATPTIGREWMIGEHGTVIDDVDPDGVVQVGEGRWRARTNRATPVVAGDEVRVAAIDGITLEIEPLEGAARDYREMRDSKSDDETASASDEIATEVNESRA